MERKKIRLVHATGLSFTAFLTNYEVFMAENDEEFCDNLVNKYYNMYLKGIIQPEDTDSTTSDTNTNFNLLENEEVIMDDETNLSQGHPTDNEVENSTRTITTWAYNEIIALIKSMETHIKDLNHAVKRKHVYENICNDLISQGFTKNVIAVQNKWKSLVRSYGKAKDNKTKSGQGPSRFMFFELLDSVLGKKPTNACSHSLDTSTDKENENFLDEIPVSDNTDDTILSGNEEIRPKTKKGMKRKWDDGMKLEYAKRKIEEYNDRKIRHAEKMEIEKRKLEKEDKKIALLEEFITLHHKRDHSNL